MMKRVALLVSCLWLMLGSSYACDELLKGLLKKLLINSNPSEPLPNDVVGLTDAVQAKLINQEILVQTALHEHDHALILKKQDPADIRILFKIQGDNESPCSQKITVNCTIGQVPVTPRKWSFEHILTYPNRLGIDAENVGDKLGAPVDIQPIGSAPDFTWIFQPPLIVEPPQPKPIQESTSTATTTTTTTTTEPTTTTTESTTKIYTTSITPNLTGCIDDCP